MHQAEIIDKIAEKDEETEYSAGAIAWKGILEQTALADRLGRTAKKGLLEV